jgi:hypothetical protein
VLANHSVRHEVEHRFGNASLGWGYTYRPLPAADLRRSERSRGRDDLQAGLGSCASLWRTVLNTMRRSWCCAGLVSRSAPPIRYANLLPRPGVRLITLLGPSGVGTPRLALRIASAVAPEFVHGAYFVQLASIRAPEFAQPRMVVTRGLRDSGDCLRNGSSGSSADGTSSLFWTTWSRSMGRLQTLQRSSAAALGSLLARPAAPCVAHVRLVLRARPNPADT